MQETGDLEFSPRIPCMLIKCSFEKCFNIWRKQTESNMDCNSHSNVPRYISSDFEIANYYVPFCTIYFYNDSLYKQFLFLFDFEQSFINFNLCYERGSIMTCTL